MKQIKNAIKNNAILLTSINFTLYDFSIIWIIMIVSYSKNKNKEMIRIINKILEKDNKNEKNNNR